MRFRLKTPGLLLLLLFQAACDGGGTAPVPSRIVISPGNTSMDALGLTQQFSASVEDGEGRPLTGFSISWSTSDPTVASVSSGGLATGLSRGSTEIGASAEGLRTASVTLTVGQLPAAVLKVSGDSQTGNLRQPLLQELEVEVTDSQGHAIEGQIVNFGILAGGGALSPTSVATDAGGRGSSVWTLGCSNDNPQRVVATVAGISVEFTADADHSLPAICQSTLPDGREAMPYSVALGVAGGDPSTMSWSTQGGALPDGLSLSPDGLMAGTPTAAGSFTFQLLAQDGMGQSAVGDFDLRICDAPITLSPGGNVTVEASGSGGCGLFLPTGATGDRYRLGVIWSTSNEGDSIDLPTVTVSGTMALAPGSSPLRSPVRVTDPPPPVDEAWIKGLPEEIEQALRVEAATEAYHLQLREKEWAMIRAMSTLR